MQSKHNQVNWTIAHLYAIPHISTQETQIIPKHKI